MGTYKIVMTGGGSAGHVTPNLALVPELIKQGFEIEYIGSKDGIEKDIIKNAGLPYHEISSGKLRRYFDLKNFSDPFKVVKGIYEAMRILSKVKPDVVFSKGGFVTVPVVIAAYLKKIPVVSHESDMTPGLANKLAAPFSDKLCVTFSESLKYVKDNKAVLTGTPIREEIFNGSKVKGKLLCGFNNNKPVLLIIGGSLGARVINDTIRCSLKKILNNFNVIHICGKGNLDKNYMGIDGYVQFEYISDELPHIMSYADFVISRAGANSIFELLALKKPNILIPLSKKASRGDQVLNANSFKNSGYSYVIQEEELNSDSLFKGLDDIVKNKERYIDAMKKGAKDSGNEKIIEVIKNTIKK